MYLVDLRFCFCVQEKAGFFVPWLICNLSAIGLTVIGVFKLILEGGAVPGFLTLLGLMTISAFFLYAVHRRHNEITKSSSVSFRQRSTVNNAKA